MNFLSISVHAAYESHILCEFVCARVCALLHDGVAGFLLLTDFTKTSNIKGCVHLCRIWNSASPSKSVLLNSGKGNVTFCLPLLINIQDQLTRALSQKRWKKTVRFCHTPSMKSIPVPCCLGASFNSHAGNCGCFREILLDALSSHSSHTKMSHRVSPCRVSSWFRAPKRPGPACCVCLLEGMEQLSTLISNTQPQVWINRTRTPVSLRLGLTRAKHVGKEAAEKWDVDTSKEWTCDYFVAALLSGWCGRGQNPVKTAESHGRCH